LLMLARDGDLVAARNLLGQIKPNGGTPYYIAATFLPFLERDYQAAIDVYDNPKFMAIFGDPSLKAFELQSKSLAHAYMGNSKQAAEIAQQGIDTILEIQAASSGTDSGNANILSSLAFSYAQTGELDKALEYANQACALIPESRDAFEGAQFSQTRALVLAMSGNRDEALLEIERLLSVPGQMDRWFLYLNPAWDFFRDDERFNELVRPLNLKETDK
jgi:tetratricopeptide (TPR) repeat protein